MKRHSFGYSHVVQGWYVPRNKRTLEKIIKELALLQKLAVIREEVTELIRKLELRSYSQSTIQNYSNAFTL